MQANLQESGSLAELLASQSEDDWARVLEQLTDDQVRALEYDWLFWARPKQLLPPGEDWRFWVLCTGRGWGKTRVGAETVRHMVETDKAGRIALLNDTAADVRDVMVEGPDGLLAVCPPWNKPRYEPSKRRVVWPNGAMAICYAAESPELLRGPQHDFCWADEFAKWKNLAKKDDKGDTAWSNLLFGLRMGMNPRAVITTTPRPVPIFRDLLKSPLAVVTTGSLHENRSNLAPQFVAEIISKFEGTRLGRQEIGGEILLDHPGALWTIDMIDRNRVAVIPCDLRRIVIAIDPPGSDNPEAAEAGIVAAGIGSDGHGYVLHDLSDRLSPAGWGGKAVEHYKLLMADRIVAERNFGGQMVEHTVRTAAQAAGCSVAYGDVNATRGKELRAEPVSALYEQNKVHHVGGQFSAMEDEMTTWVRGMKSPNRLDALVWVITELMLGAAPVRTDIVLPSFTQRSPHRIG